MRTRLLAVTLLVPVVAACGSSGSSGAKRPTTPFDIVRLAGENTVEAGSARLAMSMSGSGISMDATGVTRLDDVEGSITLTMVFAGQNLVMEMRLLGDLIYIKLPAGAGADKPWVKVDIEELSGASGVDVAGLSQLRQADPTQALAYFEGVAGDVKEAGKEDVRGASTTKYTGTLDLTKARDAQDDDDAKEAIDAAIKALGTSTLPMTVWIDAEGRMRKMTQVVDLSSMPEAGGAKGSLTTTFELFDFGVDVDVEAPPADQVGDGEDFFG